MTLTFSRVTLAGPLWTVAEAKLHLNISDAANDEDVAQKLETAQEVVLAYLGPAADETWTPETAPKGVKHAILLVTAHYREHRGDDDADREAGIWRTLQHQLGSYRDPTVA